MKELIKSVLKKIAWGVLFMGRFIKFIGHIIRLEKFDAFISTDMKPCVEFIRLCLRKISHIIVRRVQCWELFGIMALLSMTMI